MTITSMWIMFIGILSYLMIRTGKTSVYRAILFIVTAFGFLISYKGDLFRLSSSLFFTKEIKEVPYCHIAISTTIGNFIQNQWLAISSGNWTLWGPVYLGIVWLVVTFSLGQGWCSWVCFYGGFDECFSRLRRKPLWRWVKLPGKLADLPMALFIFFFFISFTTVLPVFCLWVCPLKITTGFLDVDSGTRLFQMILFIAIGITFIILIPFLTKKRAFCGLICPFGAWQSLVGRINPFRISLDTSKCTGCQRCWKACPIFAIPPFTKTDLAGESNAGIIRRNCNRCGTCVDLCQEDAIRYTLFGQEARIYFIFSAVVMTGAISLQFVPRAIIILLESCHLIKF